jgi:hypothetical protein
MPGAFVPREAASHPGFVHELHCKDVSKHHRFAGFACIDVWLALAPERFLKGCSMKYSVSGK